MTTPNKNAKEVFLLNEIRSFFSSLDYNVPISTSISTDKGVLFILGDIFASVFCKSNLISDEVENGSDFVMKELNLNVDLISADKTTVLLRISENNSIKINVGCAVITDLKTMVGICNGKVRPMAAYLSGNLKLHGDRKYFATIGTIFKDSLSKKKERERQSSRSVSKAAHQSLRVRIVSTFKVESNGNKNKDKIITRYILKVSDTVLRSTWQVDHRFSEFILLREQLKKYLQQNTKNHSSKHLPKINCSTYSLTNLLGTAAYESRIIEDRITGLQAFLDALIHMFGDKNAILNGFLGNDQRGLLLNSLQSDVGTPYSTPTRASINGQRWSQFSDGSDSDDESDQRSVDSGVEIEKAVRNKVRSQQLALQHASQYIGWRFHPAPSNTESTQTAKRISAPVQSDEIFSHSNVLIQEVLSLRSHIHTSNTLKLDRPSDNKSAVLAIFTTNKTIGIVSSLLSIAFHFLIASFSFVLVISPVISDHEANIISTIGVGFVILTLLAMSESRSTFALYWFMFTLLASLVGVFVGIGAAFSSQVVVLLQQQVDTSSTSNTLEIAFFDYCNRFVREAFLKGSSFTALQRVFSSFVSCILTQQVFVLQTIAAISRQLSMFWWCGCFLLGLLILVFSRLKRLQRAVYIYLLGCGLIALYVVTKIICTILKLSESSKTSVYTALDSVMAPFIAYEIGQLRSIFVKFAQYLGARSDVVSSVWTDSLSKLQDACPNSSAEYVRHVIESEFKKPLEELFVSFDMQPIASASIAQVHTATISRSSGLDLFNQISDHNATDPNFDMHHTNHSIKRDDSGSLAVIVKVQHEDVKEIMTADMVIAIHIAKIATRFDSRWELMTTLLEGWKKTMDDELDFRIEAQNMTEMGQITRDSKIEAVLPVAVTTLVSQKVLVMTRLYGFKVKDLLALRLYGVDKAALVTRIAHCCAHQLLVKGVFNADPHPGNILFCLKKPLSSNISGGDLLGSIVPGLLDFGMTVRINETKRRAYCVLIIALFEGDFVTAGNALQVLGYKNNQSERAPERDAEFFEYLFRDANPRGVSQKEAKEFTEKREQQKKEDIANNVREKEGRSMKELPEDFIFLSRVVGLLRGLTAELDCSCPIMYILALQARVGLAELA